MIVLLGRMHYTAIVKPDNTCAAILLQQAGTSSPVQHVQVCRSQAGRGWSRRIVNYARIKRLRQPCMGDAAVLVTTGLGYEAAQRQMRAAYLPNWTRTPPASISGSFFSFCCCAQEGCLSQHARSGTVTITSQQPAT